MDSRLGQINLGDVDLGGTIDGVSLVQTGTFENQNTFPAGGAIYVSTPQSTVGTYGRGFSQPVKPPDPNEWDRALDAEAVTGRKFGSYLYRGETNTGMAGLGRGPGHGRGPGRGPGRGLGILGPNESLAYNQRRFDNAAPEKLGKLFHRTGTMVTPTVLSGENVLVNFIVPTGYWCRIQTLYCTYTGTGFVDGSGDIEWRVQIGSVYARNMGQIGYELGTPACWFPISDYIVVPSGRRVRMLVQVFDLSGDIQIGSSRVLGGFQGYLIPYGSLVRHR